MKFLAFLIILFVAFWFFFSPKQEVVNNENINDEYSQEEKESQNEPQRKKLADMNMRDLNNSVNSGLDTVSNTIDGVTSKAKDVAKPILENENVASFISGFKARWKNFKIWVGNLPVIKQYRNSIYSDENWRNEMDATDFSNYVGTKDSTGGKMLREGTDKWKKL